MSFGYHLPNGTFTAYSHEELMEIRKKLMKRIRELEAKQSLSQQTCCTHPAKPATAPGYECKESPCCGLCATPCNSKQPCRKGWNKPSGDTYFDQTESQL